MMRSWMVGGIVAGVLSGCILDYPVLRVREAGQESDVQVQPDAGMGIPPPRPIAPLSTAIVTSQRPMLRWELARGTDGALVELCRDREMTRMCQPVSVSGTTAMPGSALSPGVWFWRLRGRAGTSTGLETSPVWQFTVGNRSASVNTSWG